MANKAPGRVIGRPFPKGVSGNPKGKPKGFVSGRTAMLMLLDALLSEVEIQDEMRAGLRKALLKAPTSFFTTVVMPLLPKESLLKIESQAPAAIRILMAPADESSPGGTTEGGG